MGTIHRMHKVSAIQTEKQSLTKRPFTRRDFLSTTLKTSTAVFTTGLLPKLKTNAQSDTPNGDSQIGWTEKYDNFT